MDRRYDIIVCGGGLAGVAAAIAAAREGTRVLLVERYGFLGGMSTAGLVNPLMAYWTKKGPGEQFDWSNIVNRGIFLEIVQELEKLGGLHRNRMTFNEELLKLVLDRMILQNGVQVLFHSFISSVKVEAQQIKSITISNKAGNQEYSASHFVDATGDADVAAFSGCEYKIGEEKSNACQPMTMCFRLSNVNTGHYAPVWGVYAGGFDGNSDACKELVNSKYAEAKDKGAISKNPREDVLTFPHMSKGVVHFNSTRITGKTPVNPEEMTEAEFTAREQVYELYTFMKGNITDFKDCELLMTAAQTGIRESRRIVGDVVISGEDILSVRKFEDSIARGSYAIDIHSPTGSGTYMMDIPYGDYYTIPYRALLPKGVNNLIVAGRPISATHEAHSAYRVLPICTCIGEGAGVAASIAAKKAIEFRRVDYKEIQMRLDAHGALY